MGAGLRSGCSTSYLAPANVPEKAAKDGLSIWTSLLLWEIWKNLLAPDLGVAQPWSL